ncbi:MAG: hypothetical protein KY434_10905 [Actinobacteria bacterium]|nr:hypothetical protein [Actinomycetota bacterium]
MPEAEPEPEPAPEPAPQPDSSDPRPAPDPSGEADRDGPERREYPAAEERQTPDDDRSDRQAGPVGAGPRDPDPGGTDGWVTWPGMPRNAVAPTSPAAASSQPSGSEEDDSGSRWPLLLFGALAVTCAVVAGIEVSRAFDVRGRLGLFGHRRG